MAVTMADITKLRKMTGAGMMDCKNALTQAEGDFDKAVKIIREKGQAVAAKRSDRDASEGCVLVKAVDGFGAMIALKCETDFVAQNADFVKLAHDILDAAVANKCKTLDEVKALKLGEMTVAEAVTDRSGITGEKMELDMQIAAMNPIAVNEAGVPEEVKANEMQVAIEKTKMEQVQKAVEAALKKAGFNLYIAENEEHLNEGIMKGNITEAQAQEIRDLKEKVAAEKAANLPAQMVENIAKGRMAKFYKENCLLNQEYIQDAKMTIADYLKSQDKDLTVLDFKRYTLRAE